MDDADRAVAREELRIELLLANRRKVTASRPAQAGIECLSCGEEIPAERRRAVPGCCLCTECQEAVERSMGR